MISSVSIEDRERFYELGFLLKPEFKKLYNLEYLVSDGSNYIFGYYIDNYLWGFIHIQKSFESIDIVNIVVDEKKRKCGIGSSLINYVINYFDDVKEIFLDVNEKNIPAVHLYNKMKFYEINRREKYYGNDTAIIMKRDV